MSRTVDEPVLVVSLSHLKPSPWAQSSLCEALCSGNYSGASLSLLSLHPFTKEILKAKEDLKTLAVVFVFVGNACIASLSNELWSLLSVGSGQRVSSFRVHQLTVSLPSAQVIMTAENMGRIHLNGEFGPFAVTFSPWSPEIGSKGASAGVTQWVAIYNLPLHYWS